MESKKSFAEASSSGSQENYGRTDESHDIDPLLLAPFLKTCMKLLHDRKVVEGIQGLIDNCIGKVKPTPELCVVRKVGKSKKRTGREMRTTT